MAFLPGRQVNLESVSPRNSFGERWDEVEPGAHMFGQTSRWTRSSGDAAVLQNVCVIYPAVSNIYFSLLFS